MKDGGPAFPRPAFSDEDQSYTSEDQSGMSLRVYIAVKVLPLLLSNPYHVSESVKMAKDLGIKFPEYVAKAACEIADAMIAEQYKER